MKNTRFFTKSKSEAQLTPAFADTSSEVNASRSRHSCPDLHYSAQIASTPQAMPGLSGNLTDDIMQLLVSLEDELHQKLPSSPAPHTIFFMTYGDALVKLFSKLEPNSSLSFAPLADCLFMICELITKFAYDQHVLTATDKQSLQKTIYNSISFTLNCLIKNPDEIFSSRHHFSALISLRLSHLTQTLDVQYAAKPKNTDLSAILSALPTSLASMKSLLIAQKDVDGILHLLIADAINKTSMLIASYAKLFKMLTWPQKKIDKQIKKHLNAEPHLDFVKYLYHGNKSINELDPKTKQFINDALYSALMDYDDVNAYNNLYVDLDVLKLISEYADDIQGCLISTNGQINTQMNRLSSVVAEIAEAHKLQCEIASAAAN